MGYKKYVETLLQSYHNITSITIQSDSELTVQGLVEILNRQPLCSAALSLRSFQWITKKELIILLKLFPGLKHFAMLCCTSIIFDFSVIGTNCPQLKSVSITDNSQIQDTDIQLLLETCFNLRSLDLSGCKNISSDVLSSIKSPPLQQFNVSGTRIRDADMKKFDSIDGLKYCMIQGYWRW